MGDFDCARVSRQLQAVLCFAATVCGDNCESPYDTRMEKGGRGRERDGARVEVEQLLLVVGCERRGLPKICGQQRSGTPHQRAHIVASNSNMVVFVHSFVRSRPPRLAAVTARTETILCRQETRVGRQETHTHKHTHGKKDKQARHPAIASKQKHS